MLNLEQNSTHWAINAPTTSRMFQLTLQESKMVTLRQLLDLYKDKNKLSSWTTEKCTVTWRSNSLQFSTLSEMFSSKLMVLSTDLKTTLERSIDTLARNLYGTITTSMLLEVSIVAKKTLQKLLKLLTTSEINSPNSINKIWPKSMWAHMQSWKVNSKLLNK